MERLEAERFVSCVTYHRGPKIGTHESWWRHRWNLAGHTVVTAQIATRIESAAAAGTANTAAAAVSPVEE